MSFKFWLREIQVSPRRHILACFECDIHSYFLFHWVLLDLLRNNYYYYSCLLRPQAVTHLAFPSPPLSHPAWFSCVNSTGIAVFLPRHLAMYRFTVAYWIVSLCLAEMLRYLLLLLHIVYTFQPKLLSRFFSVNLHLFWTVVFTCSHLYFLASFSSDNA